MNASGLLVATVAAIGVLHTLVPDHWLPIALLARQEGWTPRETIRAAGGAALGHSLSTLAIGLLVWLAGAALAARFAHTVDIAAGAALVGFGLYLVIASLRDLRCAHDGAHAHPGGHAHGHDHGHPHAHTLGHRHRHRHADGREHVHYHVHSETGWHAGEGTLAVATAPFHEHPHNVASGRALVLILGSSPMVEGIPVFFAASRWGGALIAVMAVVFTMATAVMYVALCLYSSAGLERVDLGPLERYGEVASGLLITLVGLVFLAWFH